MCPSVQKVSLPGDILRENSFATHNEDTDMHITWSLAPMVSLIAGILILVMPRLLNYIVAAYLIVFGLLGLFGDVRFT